MGIVTWGAIRCHVWPQLHKLFFVPADKLDNLIGFTYRLLRFRFGDELFILNNSNLASMLGKESSEMRSLREELPKWVLIVGVAGRDRLPEENVEFQEKDISEIGQQFGLQLVSSMPGAGDRAVLERLRTSSEEPYWRLRALGGCQDIFFLTTLDKTPEFVNSMNALSQAFEYSHSEIGIYIQPMMQGVACHCEFTLPYDPKNRNEVAKVNNLYKDGSKTLLKQGAFFSRPYGAWADMVYNQDVQTTVALKKVKEIFDSNNVMNPGKLCF
jgi:FAD/FMN-containing dehydrogenase